MFIHIRKLSKNSVFLFLYTSKSCNIMVRPDRKCKITVKYSIYLKIDGFYITFMSLIDAILQVLSVSCQKFNIKHIL